MGIKDKPLAIFNGEEKCRKILWVDVETTGLDPVRHGIWSLSAIIEIDGVEVATFDERCNPVGAELDAIALEIGCVTEEEINGFQSDRELYAKFTSFLSKHITKFDRNDKAVMAGMCVDFDDRFLRALFAKMGDKFLGSWKYPDMIDVRGLAIDALATVRHRMESFKLESIADALGIADGHCFHKSLDDLRVTRRAYYGSVKILAERWKKEVAQVDF